MPQYPDAAAPNRAKAEIRTLIDAERPTGAAVPDLGATTGVDVAAVTGTQVATQAEHDATRAKLNALLAELRAGNIIAE